MAAGFWYDHTTYPANGAAGSASAMRTELEAIQTGMDKLADPTGNTNKAVIVNSGATGYTVTTGTLALAGNFATSGAYASTFTMTGATTVTFPTTGTLATLAGTEALTNKTYNGNTWTAGTGTLTLGAGKTLTFSNTLTFTGTDSSSVAFGAGGTVAYTGNKLSAFAATTSAELASVILDETGTGLLVFATDPTFTLTDVTTNNVSATAHGWCPKFPNNTTTFLRGDGTYAAPGGASVIRSARTSNTILAVADNSTLIDITSGTFSQTLTAAATLGNGWYCYIRNASASTGASRITLDPNGAETIDGAATRVMYPGECLLVQCDGTNFNSVVLTPFEVEITATEVIALGAGYKGVEGWLWGGGGAGGKGAAGTSTGGGGGGACVPFQFDAATYGSSQSITIAAGGTGTSSNGAGGVGGNSTIGSLITAYGGGGGGGDGVSNAFGGGGGGALSAGTSGDTSGGGAGGHPRGVDSTSALNTGDSSFGGARGLQNNANRGNCGFGGGGGGSGQIAGNSVWGGAGGAGIDSANTAIAAGTSLIGGNGAAASVAGTPSAGSVPGGGGGATHTGATSGAGGAGKCILKGIA